MAMKENQHVKPIIDVIAGTVTFQTKGYADDLVLHMNKLHPDIVKRAALVGFAQVRVVDAAAVELTDEDGNVIPAEDRIATKRENMARLIAHYETGTDQWTLRVGMGGGKSITIEAIAEIKGVTYEQAQEWVADYATKGKDDKGKAFKDQKACLAYLRKGERVARKVEEIRAKRTPAPKVDADKALDELK